MNYSTPYPGMTVDLGRAAHTLAKTMDFVGVEDHSHGRRVGLLCHRIAYNLGWDQDKRHFIMLAGMLHDCGVSSTAMHARLVNEFDWSGAFQHCERGAQFLDSFGPFAQFAELILFHHQRWVDFSEDADPNTKEQANLIYLADRLDVLIASQVQNHSGEEALLKRKSLIDELRPHVGEFFAPHLFDALERAAQRPSFWLELDDAFLDDAIFEVLDGGNHTVRLRFDQVESLGELIAQVVDAKSPFTHFHSMRVADLAHRLGKLCGLAPQTCRLLRVSGLLHDVGKLRTPDEVLDKPGKLTTEERAMMARHPLDGKVVLWSIFPGTPIARWAAAHHEKLNGTGYPFGWTAEEIDKPTRILTVADIFQALCQDRPYRDRLTLAEVLMIMEGMVDKGEIDGEIVDTLRENGALLYQLATFEGWSSMLAPASAGE